MAALRATIRWHVTVRTKGTRAVSIRGAESKARIGDGGSEQPASSRLVVTVPSSNRRTTKVTSPSFFQQNTSADWRRQFTDFGAKVKRIGRVRGAKARFAKGSARGSRCHRRFPQAPEESEIAPAPTYKRSACSTVGRQTPTTPRHGRRGKVGLATGP